AAQPGELIVEGRRAGGDRAGVREAAADRLLERRDRAAPDAQLLDRSAVEDLVGQGAPAADRVALHRQDGGVADRGASGATQDGQHLLAIVSRLEHLGGVGEIERRWAYSSATSGSAAHRITILPERADPRYTRWRMSGPSDRDGGRGSEGA